MQCTSASSVEATWEQKSVTVILLNPVLMPELFSVLGEPLNCQCSFSHLPLLSPVTLLRLSVVDGVLSLCMCNHLLSFFSSSSFFFLIFCYSILQVYYLISAHNAVSLIYCTLVRLTTFFIVPVLFHFPIDTLLSCGSLLKLPFLVLAHLLPKIDVHVSGPAHATSEVCCLSLPSHLSF